MIVRDEDDEVRRAALREPDRSGKPGALVTLRPEVVPETTTL